MSPDPVRRESALRALDLPGMDAAALSDLASLASALAGTPRALVNVVGTSQRTIASHGGHEPDHPLEISFCARVVESGQEVVVDDTRQDERFRDNPLALADPPLRFYAGFPVAAPDGQVLATLCVADSAPRALTEAQRSALRVLAAQVGSQVELHVRRQEQARRHDLVEAVLDTVEVGIVACDAEGRLTLFNPATREMHGLDADGSVPPEQWAERFDLYEVDGTTLLAPDRVPLRRALVEGSVAGQEMVIAPRGLPARRVRCEGRALRDRSGRVTGAVCAMVDVTDARASSARLEAAHAALRLSAAELARREEEFRTAFERGPLAMCRLDADGVVVAANPAVRRLLGRRTAAVLGRRLVELVEPQDAPRLQESLDTAGSGSRPVDWTEVRMLRADGTALWCEVAVSGTQDRGGEHALLVQVADVDDRHRREAALKDRLDRDPLTGLASRVALQAALRRRLEQGDCAVLFLDLDGFKRVNDTAGHAAGDAVLVEVARRLRAVLRERDDVGRLGGDEFVVLAADDVDVTGLVGRVRDAVARPVLVGAAEHAVGVSVGVVRARSGEDVDAVLAEADRRMYLDKLPAQVDRRR